MKQGDTVKLTLSTRDVPHSLSIKDFGVNIKVAKDKPGVGEFVANKKGTFHWRCRIECGSGHDDMGGTLVVE